jgi:hypothetical protein
MLHQTNEWLRFCANDCLRDSLSHTTYFCDVHRLRGNRVGRIHPVLDNRGLERCTLCISGSGVRRHAAETELH